VRRRRAFSLIELSVVLVILAIAAAAVALNARARMRRATLDDAVGALGRYDGATRAAARRQDRPIALLMDLSAGRVNRVSPDGDEIDAAPLMLPGGVRIARVLVGDRCIDYGEAAIRINTLGLSRSYAVLLDDGNNRRWLLAAGLTGRIVEIEDEDEVADILAATAGR